MNTRFYNAKILTLADHHKFEITETADAVAPMFKQLLTETIKNIAKTL